MASWPCTGATSGKTADASYSPSSAYMLSMSSSSPRFQHSNRSVNWSKTAAGTFSVMVRFLLLDPESHRRGLALGRSGGRRRHEAVSAGLQLPASEASVEVEAVRAGHRGAAEAPLERDD